MLTLTTLMKGTTASVVPSTTSTVTSTHAAATSTWTFLYNRISGDDDLPLVFGAFTALFVKCILTLRWLPLQAECCGVLVIGAVCIFLPGAGGTYARAARCLQCVRDLNRLC